MTNPINQSELNADTQTAAVPQNYGYKASPKTNTKKEVRKEQAKAPTATAVSGQGMYANFGK